MMGKDGGASMVEVLLGLEPRAAVRLPVAHGHLVHAWFLDVVKQCDPGLATELHRDRPAKPFALSMLQGGQGTGRASLAIGEGQPCSLRLTALDEPTGAVLRAIAAGATDHVTVGDAEFRVAQVSIRAQSFEKLWAQALSTTGGHTSVRMRFTSPTAFKTGRQNIVFPLPGLILRGLCRKWSCYAPPQFFVADSAMTERAVWVGRHSLHTECLEFGGYAQIGFVGTCDFIVDSQASQEIGSAVRALLSFAAYAGVGYKTTMGMGQVAVHL